MAESKFTPGPWEVHGPTEEGNASRRVFSGTTYLGTVTNSDMDPEETKANADLMADAPALLRVLRNLLTYSEPLLGWQHLDEAEQAFTEAHEMLEKHGG